MQHGGVITLGVMWGPLGRKLGRVVGAPFQEFAVAAYLRQIWQASRHNNAKMQHPAPKTDLAGLF
eukprot:1143263-Pelagomonas_calceolata.AAC.4